MGGGPPSEKAGHKRPKITTMGLEIPDTASVMTRSRHSGKFYELAPQIKTNNFVKTRAQFLKNGLTKLYEIADEETEVSEFDMKPTGLRKATPMPFFAAAQTPPA